MKLLAVAEQSRIHYVKENIEKFTFEKLVELLHKAWGIGISDVTHAHWSPPCSSMSTADLGTNNYRWPDGTARPGTVAAIHDRIFNKFFGLWEQIAGAHPGLLMSVENPVGWFQHMPAVTNLLRRDHSWQLCETHYCRAADEELDKFMTWSKKPTHFLVRNIPLGYRLPQCEQKCRYRFPEGSQSVSQFYSIAKQGIMRGVLLPLKQSSYAVCLLCLLPDTELAASLLRADIRHGSLGS